MPTLNEYIARHLLNVEQWGGLSPSYLKQLKKINPKLWILGIL